MHSNLIFLCFSVIFCTVSGASLVSESATSNTKPIRDNNGLPAINGDSNLEIFKKYRCRVCDDIMIDNVELVDGELVLNEKLAVKLCDTFLSKVLHNSFGGILCHTVVQTKLDEIIKKIVSSGAETRIGEQICAAIHFCEKD